MLPDSKDCSSFLQVPLLNFQTKLIVYPGALAQLITMKELASSPTLIPTPQLTQGIPKNPPKEKMALS